MHLCRTLLLIAVGSLGVPLLQAQNSCTLTVNGTIANFTLLWGVQIGSSATVQVGNSVIINVQNIPIVTTPTTITEYQVPFTVKVNNQLFSGGLLGLVINRSNSSYSLTEAPSALNFGAATTILPLGAPNVGNAGPNNSGVLLEATVDATFGPNTINSGTIEVFGNAVGEGNVYFLINSTSNSCGAPPAPSITTSPLPPGISGQFYLTTTLGATGGTLPYTWSANNLPKGLTIDPSTGQISGFFAPDAESSSYFDTTKRQFSSISVTVTDSSSPPQTATNQNPFTIDFTCGDDRDTVIEEYQTYNNASYIQGMNPFPLNPPSTGKGIQPYCAAFTNSAESAKFTFAQLNANDADSPNWALIRTALTTDFVAIGPNYGLSDWVTEYNAWATQPQNAVFNTPRRIISGYRSPKQQAKVSGNNRLGQPCTTSTLTDVVGCTRGGRHQFGDAVDLQNNSHTDHTSVQSCPPPRNSSAYVVRLCTEWTAMAEAAQRVMAGPPPPGTSLGNGVNQSGYIEPLGVSGIGHVHADWRNVPGQFEHGPNDPQ
jgi:hypothetical protein